MQRFRQLFQGPRQSPCEGCPIGREDGTESTCKAANPGLFPQYSKNGLVVPDQCKEVTVTPWNDPYGTTTGITVEYNGDDNGNQPVTVGGPIPEMTPQNPLLDP